MKQVTRIFLRNKKGEYLLVRHKGNSNWTLPGGHIEEGETIFKAIKREIKEELDLEITLLGNTLGLDIENIKEKPSPICSYKISFEKQNGKTVKKTEYIFLGVIKDENEKIKLQEDEIDECRFFSKNEILHLENTFYQFKEILKKI